MVYRASRHGGPEVKVRRLSPARRQLVDLVQRIGYGQIYSLPLIDREPVMSPQPRFTCTRLCGAITRGMHRSVSDDYTLKSPWVEFFRDIDVLNNGVIENLTIAAGMPRKYALSNMIPA
jgi:hypothetical protein